MKKADRILKCVWIAVLCIICRGFAQSTPVDPASSDLSVNPDPPLVVFQVDPKPHHASIIDWVAATSWGRTIEVGPSATKDQVCALREKGFNVIPHLHANEDILKRHNEYMKRPVPDIDDVIARHLQCVDCDTELLAWLMLIENDSSGVGHPQELLRAKPKTHARARQLLDANLAKAVTRANQYPQFQQWGLCGYSPSAHAFARSGIDAVIVERTNDDVDDVQTGIAFTRGAARQFGCDWGVDFSLWWGPIYGCIQNLPDSYHKRSMFISYYAGAQIFRIEGGDLFWDHSKQKLQSLAYTLDQWANFMQKYPPGTCEVPVAVVLDPDHGWMTPPYWRTTRTAWNYAKIPYRMGQKGIDGFFHAAFPASRFAMQPYPFGTYTQNDPPASPFALSCITPEFAPHPSDIYFAEPPIPFGRYNSRDDARNYLVQNQLETAPYRPLASSRWGDIFDVLTSAAKPDVLSEYKVLILLGQVKIDPEMEQKLIRYVKQGGTLVAAAGVITPDHQALTGLDLTGELHPAYSWQFGDHCPVSEPLLYVPARAVSSSAQALAHSGDSIPLLFENTLGKGKVYTCLAPWFEGHGTDMSLLAQRLFDHVLAPVSPVKVTPAGGIPAPGPLQWLTTTSGDFRTVVIANHQKTRVWADISIDSAASSFKNCTELLTGQIISLKKSADLTRMAVQIPGWDLVILRLTP